MELSPPARFSSSSLIGASQVEAGQLFVKDAVAAACIEQGIGLYDLQDSFQLEHPMNGVGLQGIHQDFLSSFAMICFYGFRRYF